MQIRILILFTVVSLISATSRAADDSFVGQWKLNPAKSQFNGLSYKIEDLGGDKYRLSFGDNSDEIPADGKDHPSKYGSTWAITKTSANNWKFTRKREGKVTSEEMWNISDDGQTFTIKTDEKRPDGSTTNDETKMKRTAGASGFVGTWESSEVKIGSPTVIRIEKWQGDGYSMATPVYKEQLDFKLDGKDYADKGPRVATGLMASGKRTDDHNIALTYKLKGKELETDRWEVSTDGKTLTDTITFAGVSKPEVDVYDKQ